MSEANDVATKSLLAFSVVLLLIPAAAHAQGNVPAPAQRAADAAQDTVQRFGMGVEAGVGLNPEVIDFGVHGTFGPIFNRAVQFRPEFEVGIGELTTLFGVNLDFLYTFSGATSSTRWAPYVGAGPNFKLSHKGFSLSDIPSGSGSVNVSGTTVTADNVSRFNFGDTTFKAGFDFIAGARMRNGVFVEMNASAFGVTNVRLLAGFNF